MRDLNFFESYIEKNEFKLDKKIVYFTVTTFTVLSLMGYIVYNEILIRQESKIVESLRATAENPKTLEKVAEIKGKEVEVNEYRESVEKIKSLDKSLKNRDVIDEILLETINSKIPNDLFLTSLSIQDGEIYIVGISKDKWAVAEFEKGLEALENHKEIFVSNISQDGDDYSFSINITLRGVNGDGEESQESKEKKDN